MNSESPKSTPAQMITAPVGATTSLFDNESAVSFSNNNADVVSENTEPTPIHPEFAFSDGNIQLQTTNQTFWIHEYHLNKFAVFAALIQAARSSGKVSDVDHRIAVACDKTTNGEDIYNTLKVIYASHIDGVPDFDSSTLTSTLRIATSFDYPVLRKFAISKLEGMDVPAIQRIQLSDEFSLPSWETPAFTELCSRKEPISQAEAEILGMSRFVEIARIRETERTRLAVKFAGGVYEELLEASGLASSLQSDNSGGAGAQNAFEYSSGRSMLPACNCYVGGNQYNGYVVKHCSLHQVAPQVLKEGQSLLKERDDLLDRFGKIRSTINSRLEHGNPLSKLDDGLDLNMELSRASWIRRECTVAS